MKNNITELVFILDKSGSMAGLESDTVGGFNSLIEKQKKEEGDAYVTAVLFDNDSEFLYDRVELKKVSKMEDKDYVPGGCTALLDALGDTVKHIKNIHKYARKEDVPEHTMFVIITDGAENASKKYSSDQVKKEIEKRKKDGWEFLFLGANIDAVEVAGNIGISRERAVEYKCDSRGTKLNYSVLSRAISSVRECSAISDNWKDEIEEDLKRGKF